MTRVGLKLARPAVLEVQAMLDCDPALPADVFVCTQRLHPLSEAEVEFVESKLEFRAARAASGLFCPSQSPTSLTCWLHLDKMAI